jgi:hypothetical protein
MKILHAAGRAGLPIFPITQRVLQNPEHPRSGIIFDTRSS